MAYFDKSHSDLKQVANFDARDYEVGALNALTDGAAVQPQGPKLDFATITKGSGAWTGDQVKTIVDTIQQLAVVYIYQYDNSSPDTLSIAFYPTGAWGDVTDTGSGSLDAAITAATAACSITASATFNN
jgi:hypothetical protein